MSGRWLYKVVEVPVKLFGGGMTALVQAELDKLGPQGWELVSAVQGSSAEPLRLFLKKAS